MVVPSCNPSTKEIEAKRSSLRSAWATEPESVKKQKKNWGGRSNQALEMELSKVSAMKAREPEFDPQNQGKILDMVVCAHNPHAGETVTGRQLVHLKQCLPGPSERQDFRRVGNSQS